MDIVIKSGVIVDGSGDARFKADIGIEKGKIVKIGSIRSKGDKEIDASGLIVAPGFIDMHSHSDVSLLIHRRAESSIRQGITTEAICNCGNSPAPLSDKNREWALQRLTSSSFVDINKLDVDWSTFGDWLNRMEKTGIGVNVAPFAGHGTIRTYVIGLAGEGGEKGWINLEELEAMKVLVREAMDAGAFGMTTALRYSPGKNAHPLEVIELTKIVAEYDGLYMSDLRSSGPGNIPTPVEAVEECIYICEKSKVRGQISHVFFNIYTQSNVDILNLPGYTKGVVEDILKLINNARAKCLDLHLDVIPFIESGVRPLLIMFVPYVYHHFVSTYKQPEELLKEMRDPDAWLKIKRDVEDAGSKYWLAYKNYKIAYSVNTPECQGKTLDDVAEMRGVDYVTAARDLLLENEGDVRVKIGRDRSEEELIQILKNPVSMPATDSSAKDWRPSILEAPAGKSIGTFPNVLGKYVREKKILTLEDAIKKITSLPAHVLRLKNRGRIKEGMWADITIFEADKICNRSTITEPFQHPEGIEYVLVNGNLVLDRGEPTGTIAGKVLRLTKQ